MSFSNGPTIVTNGLVLALDAGDRNSYVSGSSTWFDLVGSSNGTLTNGPTFDTGSGGSIVFDGINDYVPTSTLSTQFASTGLTVSLFLYYIPQQENSNVICWGVNAFNSGNSYSWELRFRTGSGFLEFAPGATATGTGGTDRLQAASAVGWGNRILSLDITYIANGLASIYENGVLRATRSYSGIGTSTVTNPVWVGRGTDTYFPGRIYSTKLYNRALSADEILQNYNAQKSKFGL